METAMMEGSSNANVFFDTRHRCAKNSAASVAISQSAEERNFQDKESVTLSALLGGGGSLSSETPLDAGFSAGVFSRGLAGDSTGSDDSRPTVVNASLPLLGMRVVAPSDAKASTREGVGVVIETERAGRADTPSSSLETSTPVGGSRAGAGAATTPSSPIPKLPLMVTGSIVAHERDTASVMTSSGDSRNHDSLLRRNLHGAATANTGVPAGGEDFSELGSRAGNEEAVPLLQGIGYVDFGAAGSGNGARGGGEGRTDGRGNPGSEKGGGRTASPAKKGCSAVLCQAGRQELEKGRGESPASDGFFAEGGRGDGGNGLAAAAATISAAGAMRPKNPDGFGEENVVHVAANTGGNGKPRNGSTNSNSSGISSSCNSTVTESSGGRTSSDADVLRRQFASLLARVEFLERRQRCVDDAAVVGATTPVARGAEGSGGSGDTSSFAAAARRRGSWFLPGEAGDCKGQGQTFMTPPPQMARGTEGRDSLVMGVSSTPFTGLDVLFRTPKVQEPQHQQYDYQVVEQLEYHPPLSPSRARTRWAPSSVPSLPQRSRLTWCAGETQDAVEARGGRAPPPETSGSPPDLRLSTDGGGVVASKASEGAGTSLRRPRSRTEVAVGRSSGEGRDRGNELFSIGRDSGSPRRSRSPLIGPCRGGKEGRAPSPSRLTEEDGVTDTTEGIPTGRGYEERLSAGSGRDEGYGSRSSSISLLGYLRVEIFGAEDHGEVDKQANRTVQNFLTVPRQLEKLLLFGMLVCLDTFLYVTTFLPIRIVIGVVSALFSLVTRRGAPKVNRPLLYDWMRGGTIAVSLFALQFLEMSRVYHYIRGQAMVKLYVLTAMMEIFDKLMCSFGQDALDSLYLSTVHKKKRRVLVHFVVVCVTACLHSLLLFIHVITLTVAVNTSDQALLTLLISNNFAEIKSSVFKKFDKHNLFQLSCHDVVERFKLALFLGMIILLNVCQGGLDDPLSQFSSIFGMVFAGEVLADWIKHGFIIKFNQLTPSIYEEYATILARDVASFRKDDGSALDHTHFVARRLAFATVPLNCVMIRFIQMAVPKLLQRLPSAPTAALWTAGILFYLSALALKVLTGISLMAQACRLHPDAVIFSTEAASWLRSPMDGAHKTRREHSLGKLSTIERFTLWKGRIV